MQAVCCNCPICAWAFKMAPDTYVYVHESLPWYQIQCCVSSSKSITREFIYNVVPSAFFSAGESFIFYYYLYKLLYNHHNKKEKEVYFPLSVFTVIGKKRGKLNDVWWKEQTWMMLYLKQTWLSVKFLWQMFSDSLSLGLCIWCWTSTYKWSSNRIKLKVIVGSSMAS